MHKFTPATFGDHTSAWTETASNANPITGNANDGFGQSIAFTRSPSAPGVVHAAIGSAASNQGSASGVCRFVTC